MGIYKVFEIIEGKTMLCSRQQDPTHWNVDSIMAFDKKQIVKLRNGHELTQLDFARRIGTSRNVVAKWEAGDNKPSLDYLVKISWAFHVPVSYFFNGEDNV